MSSYQQDQQRQADMKLVKRGWTDADLGPAIRGSVAFEMAEQRLAARGDFWQWRTTTDGLFVHVPQGD